jgi:hypothetical protein
VFRTPGTALTLRHADADRGFVAAQIIDELELRDGERILVRHIQPADGDQLAGVPAGLSRDSIYWRYFGFTSTLSTANDRRSPASPRGSGSLWWCRSTGRPGWPGTKARPTAPTRVA